MNSPNFTDLKIGKKKLDETDGTKMPANFVNNFFEF